MNNELIELLEELLEYMERKSDADWNGEKQVPNKEMQLSQRIDEQINQLKKDQ